MIYLLIPVASLRIYVGPSVDMLSAVDDFFLEIEEPPNKLVQKYMH